MSERAVDVLVARGGERVDGCVSLIQAREGELDELTLSSRRVRSDSHKVIGRSYR